MRSSRRCPTPRRTPRQIVERAALALLTYIEENSEGFQVLVRDSPTTDPAGSFNSLLGDISLRVEDLLTAAFKRRKLSAKGVPYYAQMLVGMTVFTGQYWGGSAEGQQGAARRIRRRPRMARPEPAGFQADPAVREPEGEAARSQGRQRTSRQRAERDNGPGRAGRSCRDRRTGRTGIPARERRLIIRTAHKPEAPKTAERTTGLA